MDVDAGPSLSETRIRSEVVFAQSEEQKVSLVSQLPAEVLQVLRNTDFVSNTFIGDVDTRNSFCLIASTKTCFVWKYSQLLPGAPTCYIFPCPNRFSETEPAVPSSALVSYGSSREPGLILVSPYGELHFWDSIGLGLTGGEATDASLLDLRSDETVTTLIYAEPLKFVATTSTGRLFLLSITSTEGRFRVASHPFTLTRPQGTMERLRSGFWGEKPPSYSGGFITAASVTDVNDEGFEVWICADMKVVRWTVLYKGWEQFEAEEDIEQKLLPPLEEAFKVTSGALSDLELLDIAFDAEDHLVLLASFSAGVDNESSIDTRPRRHYVVVRMKREDNMQFAGIRTVPYQTISSDRANIHPRLRLLDGGRVYCVQFGDAVALAARDNNYTSLLTLKNLQDRTFGCGVLNNSSDMLFMNSDVLMRVSTDIEKINSYNVNTWKGTSIKSIMTQAILFGSNPKNPLLFTFPPDVDEESLISGAEQLSRAVLASDAEVVRPNPDLSQQIRERKDRLRFLIGFINENGALGKMSQTSRQRLVVDAEKLHATQELWILYCELLNSGLDDHILLDAINAYMEESDKSRHDDVMRAFLRLETRDIGNLLPYIKHEVGEIIRDYNLAQQTPDALYRGTDYVLCILESAWSFRDLNMGIYGVVGPMLNPWTSSPAVIDIVLDFFNLSDRLLIQTPPEAENKISQDTRRQLPRLGATVFRCFQERQNWLESAVAADETGIESEKRAHREHFQQVRPQILQTLFKHGKSEDAFVLAENYRDFRSLVDLCHSTPPIYPFASNVNAERIKEYIEKYKEEFTDELYLWYVEHGEVRCLFEQSETYGEYIDAFFIKHPYPNVSWVHDIGKGRWGSASSTLLTQVDRTLDLETRHVMLSIGKLSQIAESEKSQTRSDTILDAFHDGLDYVSVHDKLIEELRAPLAGSKQRQSLENQADAIMKAVAPALKPKTYSGFHSEFKASVKEVLQNHALRVEDLIDILTLKESTLDFETALALIKNAKNLPEARQLSCFRTIWRRIYIHDDWARLTKTVNVTDTQLVERFRKTALYATVRDTFRRLRFEQGTPSNPDDLLTTPNIVLPVNEAAQLPSREELESRWPGHTDEQIEALSNDYANERQRLVEFDLVPVVERVKELAVQELKEEFEVEDIAMNLSV
ncbi:uncharacterized protein FOMMEDRAFT_124682 [Fomitiporia mediterranea MF3/22]|uniref:uncharacterized protein n=1 Tax=Fomitiporia mediterranea (strain MF3/22) TaxID=694068 RepID=UPI0004409A03|nr:uncharacterized protein FOMMEDRAFT_124682 [Fomitiporia mediterranea MF3/22]EJD02313.1 hypothetical protein FOMMEDRAFT_124682 [Fomitiporia mediterranea MF3/22]